jgi:hypothetical protein
LGEIAEGDNAFVIEKSMVPLSRANWAVNESAVVATT